MKKEHPHAQVYRWIADGENVQACKLDGSEPWWSILEDASYTWWLELLHGRHHGQYEFRIKPKTIKVGDREIEAPIKSGPGYYLTNYGDVFRWFEDANLNPPIDLQKLGRVFATEEAARAAQEAITALLTREPS
ncbi:MAG: hypothetical protein E2581_08695 [Pseudomonas sp.]|uniref:hypothetical protein n=1 Tax=Pseudomonadota TaxID=1224 RepID=UPI001D47FE73|nr:MULTISPECIES: hypothetical protein [Pseudomonadota]MPS98564.1 hypothetical protein [Pseudomonas sp.]MPT55010.1 hypothetical protein [Delftia sp.]